MQRKNNNQNKERSNAEISYYSDQCDEVTCPECHGTGYDPLDGGQCDRCNGMGVIDRT